MLPLAAAGLLAALALAPSWKSGPDANRVAYHMQTGNNPPPASRLLGARYHGMDQQGRPFTITAASAVEQGGGNVSLSAPMADITLKSGAWLMLKAKTGLYQQQADQLNLSGHVMLYRNDGTTLTTAAAHIDMRAGSANASTPAQVDGPFGTLTAQNGFILTGQGANITFNGPAKLTLLQTQ